jgi:precorrin-2 dehydrogenase / sirohydrochlorin ferrochelatase
MPSYYPIMLDVHGRVAVVVGGDVLAAEKAAALADCGARVTVVAPAVSDAVLALAARADWGVTLRVKTFELAELDGAFVVVAATTDEPALTELIWAETQRRGQLLNVVDVPARCTYILPSVLRRDQLTIAVSTEGASPSLAKRIRQRLEALFPGAYGPFLRLAASARDRLRAAGVHYAQRDAFFGDYLASNALERLEAGDEAAAVATVERLLDAHIMAAHDAAAPTISGAEVAHADR